MKKCFYFLCVDMRSTHLGERRSVLQATINFGTIGHVAHGKSTVVRAVSGVQTVRFKHEKERNITIKLGYALRPKSEMPCWSLHEGVSSSTELRLLS